MGFPAAAAAMKFIETDVKFQSLIGFYGFSGLDMIASEIVNPYVSIPDRVLWVFRH